MHSPYAHGQPSLEYTEYYEVPRVWGAERIHQLEVNLLKAEELLKNVESSPEWLSKHHPTIAKKHEELERKNKVHAACARYSHS